MSLRAIVRGALAAFIVAAVVVQVATPAIGPARHMVSELARGRLGWVMQFGFGCWAVALLGGGFVAGGDRRRLGPARWWVAGLLAIAGVGVVVLIVFRTETVAGVLPPGVAYTTGGRLHDVGSGTATWGLVAAAVLVAIAARRRAPATARATVAILGVAVVASVVGLAIGASVGGVRQRVLLIAAVAWEGFVLLGGEDPTRVGRVAGEAAGGDQPDRFGQQCVLDGP